MATDLEKLVVQLSANMTQYERAMKRAGQVADDLGKQIDKRNAASARNSAVYGKMMATGMTRALAPVAGSIAAAVSVVEVAKAADEWTNVGNRLKTAGLQGEALVAAQRETAQIAIATNSELGTTAGLYAKLIPIATQYGKTQADAATATTAISQALAMAGLDAGTASGTITQLGQALSSGVLRGDEFNSVMEGLGTNSPIIKAIAKEFGVATTELRKMAEAGELVSDRVLNAIVSAAPDIGRQFKAADVTVSAAFGNMKTALTALIGEMDRSVGASRAVAGAMQSMAQTINSIAIGNPVAAAQQNLADAAQQLKELQARASGYTMTPRGPVRTALPSDAPTRTGRGGMSTGQSPRAQLAAQVEGAKAAVESGVASYINEVAKQAVAGLGAGGLGSLPDELKAPPPDLSGYRRNGKVVEPPTKPNAEATLPAPDEKAGERAIKVAERHAQAVADDIARTRERTEATRLEAEMMGLSAGEQERRRTELELTQSAQREGIDINSKMAGSEQTVADAIRRSSEAAGLAAENLERLQDLKSVQQEIGQAFASAFEDAIINGENLGDVLQNLTKRLASMALQNALLGSNGSGGIFGTLLGAFKIPGLAEGGYTGNGGKLQPAGMVHKGEYVFSAAATKRIGVNNLEAMHRAVKGYAAGGYVGAPAIPTLRPASSGPRGAGGTVVINMDNRGADVAAVAKIDRSLAQLKKDLPSMVVSINRSSQTRKTI